MRNTVNRIKQRQIFGLLIAFLSLFFGNSLFAQNVGIGTTSFTPDAASILDLRSPSGNPANSKGLLIPRVVYADRPSGVGASSNGMLIYQTDDNGTNTHGFYYWDNTISTWLPFLSSSAASSTAGWLTLGNSGTTALTNFIGTKDNASLTIRTNNAQRIKIDSLGNVGIGTTTPASTLHVLSSGAKTLANTAAFINNTSTSSTNSIDKVGLEVQSNGSWTGTSANNIGISVSNVSGGTANYDAIFNGGNNVGIGLSAPTLGKLQIADASSISSNAALRIDETGASAGYTYGLYSAVTGAAAGNVAGYFTTSGGSTFNYSVYGLTSATGGLGVWGKNTSTGPGQQTGIKGEKTGSNAAATGKGVIGNASGTALENYGGYFTSSAGTTNIGGYFSATTVGANNYAIIVPNNGGSVGIGTSAPDAIFEVVKSSTLPATSGSASNAQIRITYAGGAGSSCGELGINPSLPYGMYLRSTRNNDQSINDPLSLQPNGGNVGIGTSSPAALLSITQTLSATGALKGIVYTGAVNTNQTLSTEIPSVTITTAGRQWATGAIATQREVAITQPTYSFVGASTITNAATVGIAGAPIQSTNATLTNTHALLIQAGAVSTAAASYGLTVNAQTGATNNYTAQFLGGNVGIGTSSPAALLSITQTTSATGALKGIVYTGAVNTNQTLSTEIPSVTITTAGRQWATGAIATQREVAITQPTYSFVGASIITDAATVGIAGAPIQSTNATLTNTHALLIQAGAVSTAASSFGLTVNAQTGATNNYTAQFLGGNVGVGNSAPKNTLDVSGSFGRGAPVTNAVATYTVLSTGNWLIMNNAAGVSLTLPAAASFPGRELMIKTIAAGAVTSATANVVPLAGGAAATAILAATIGKWATLVSNGTNWVIMQAN